MPTGYTAALCEGEQSFEDFVKDAAGAFIRPGMDVLVEEPSTFYMDLVAEEELKLANMLGWSADQIDAEYASARAKIDQANEERRVRAGATIRRLVEMKTKVHKWIPPTDKHVNFKNFMLEQLTITIDSEFPYQQPLPDMESIVWYDQKVEDLKESIRRHVREQQDEEKRVAERNAWRAALLESLA